MKPQSEHITTISGRKFWPLEPRVEDIDIHDIAWSLSRICRFGGHTTTHYSVATHSIAVSYLVPPEDALWGLLHDASEAYVGDMVRPLKNKMNLYRGVEDKVVVAITTKFGLQSTMPDSVHRADMGIVKAEKFLFTNQTPLELTDDLRPYVDTINAVLPCEDGTVDVYLKFLNRFKELTEHALIPS